MAVRLLPRCSPRDGSNSGLLAVALERLAEKYQRRRPSVIALRDLHIENCSYCNVCGKTKDDAFLPCVMADRRDRSGARRPWRGDGIVIATPVYFGLPSDLFSSSSCAQVLRSGLSPGQP